MRRKSALARTTRRRRFIRAAPHCPQQPRSASSVLAPAAVPSAALCALNEPSAQRQLDPLQATPSIAPVTMNANSAFPVPSGMGSDSHQGLFIGSAASRYAPAMTALGTGSPPFSRTLEDPAAAAFNGGAYYYESICAMPAYASKSPEELRFEDYCTKMGNPGTVTPFPLFGQSATAASLFVTPWQPSALRVTPVLSNGFRLDPPAAPSGGGFGISELFQNQTLTFGTGFPRFCMFQEIDANGAQYHTVMYHSICAMPAYRSKSPEELRYEDYLRMQNCLPDAA